MDSSNIFTYGTLMYRSVWEQVVSGDYTSTPAKLLNYRKRAVCQEVYPALVQGENGTVDGVLYRAVSQNDIIILDRFEGSEYQRIEVVVQSDGDTPIRAYTYVLHADFHEQLLPQDWDRVAFEKHGMQVFLDGYKGFHNIG